MADRFKKLNRDQRYEQFKKQVDWDGWSTTTREVFDELFPPDPEKSITETLGLSADG